MGENPRVAVVGVGAIGAFFAAHLIEAGTADVSLCVRRPFSELVLESGESRLRSTPRVLTEPDTLDAPMDWVLLATKAHQTVGAKPWLDRTVGPDTTVVVLQNGVEHIERVRPLLLHEAAEILPAVVYCGAELLEPGHAVHRSNGFLVVPSGASADQLVALFEPSRAGIRTSDDFTTTMWQKLCANVVANGITAITERGMEVMRRPDVADVGRALIRECLTVARAEGATIDDSYVELLVEGIAKMPDESGTSMLYDRLAGHPLEYDAKYGAVSRAGGRHDIATPLHDTFAALLAAISDGSIPR